MKKIFLLDGGTGTTLSKMGVLNNENISLWALENEKILQKMQKNFVDNGSDIIYSCTFGANRIKLAGANIVDTNAKLVEISKKVSSLVAGDVSPTGLFCKPYGDTSFDEMVDIFAEQISGLYKGGADYIVIETMTNVPEAKAAVTAAKQMGNLPILLTMTFDKGRTLDGATPKTVAVTFQNMGVSAVGCNCSTGPQDMLPVIQEMSEVCKIPLIAKPNAGLPTIVNGETQFTMTAKEFADISIEFTKYNLGYFGGCCGTTPEFIKEVKEKFANITPKFNFTDKEYLASSRDITEITEKTIYSNVLTADENLFDNAMNETDNGAEVLLVKANTKEELNYLYEYEAMSSIPIKLV